MAECNRTEVAVRERTSRPGESRCDVIETTNIRQSAVTAFKQVGQFFVVDAEQCEHGGVQVVDVDFVFDGSEAEFVGRADDLATANATAREPCRVAVGIVVAALIALHHGRAAEFTGPGDERRVEQPALCQIGQQAGDWPINGRGDVAMIRRAFAVGVPVGTIELDIPNTAFDHPPREQAHTAEAFCGRRVESVQIASGGGLTSQIDQIRCGRLHAKRELVIGDPCFEPGVIGARERVSLVPRCELVQNRALMSSGEL